MALAQAGHDLMLVAHTDRDGLDRAKQDAQALGAACRTHLCDVSGEAAVADLFKAIGPDANRLSGLVNNAGYAGERAALADTPMDEADRILAVNVRGAVLMCRAH